MTSLHKIYKLQAKLLSEIEREREFIEKSVGVLQKESRKALARSRRQGPIRSKQRQARRSSKRTKVAR